MKRSPVVNDHLQMPSMYISPGSTMFLAKKSKFLFPGHFLGSRRTLENLFVRFERTLNGVVFDEKNSAGNHCAFAGERLKYS